jgi:hypothetical protein
VGLTSKDGGNQLYISATGSEYSEKELSVLRSLVEDNRSGETDVRLEILLANEIMHAHQGKLSFDESDGRSGFKLVFAD